MADRAFFTVGQRNGHLWFITPEGEPFWSIGMNHIDSATMRYPENVHIWREQFGNSQERWLREQVAPDLRAWGFNSVGWVQEVIVRGPTIHRRRSGRPRVFCGRTGHSRRPRRRAYGSRAHCPCHRP